MTENKTDSGIIVPPGVKEEPKKMTKEEVDKLLVLRYREIKEANKHMLKANEFSRVIDNYYLDRIDEENKINDKPTEVISETETTQEGKGEK